MQAIKKNKKILIFFLKYQKPYLKKGMVISGLLLFNVCLTLPMPLIARYLIDKVIATKNYSTLNRLCIILFLLIVALQVSRYFSYILLAKYKALVRYDLEKELYLHIQKLPISFFSNKKTGYIMERISEISSADILMVETIVDITKNIITFLIGAFLILKFHLKLGLISLSVLPLFVYSMKRFHKILKSISLRLLEAEANYKGKLERNINSIERIKTKIKELFEGERFSESLKRYLVMEIKSEKVSALANIIASFIGSIAPFIVLWYGISEIMKGKLSVGTFFAINSFLGYLYGPAQSLTNISYKISYAIAGLERVYELFNLKEESDGYKDIAEISDIILKNVSFSYNKGHLVLDNVTLKIKKGEKVAIVGKSGEGKSTFFKLLLKLYLPQEGEIFISGFNIKEIRNNSLRSKIHYVSQESILLEDDIKDKIISKKITKTLKKFNLDIDIDRIYQKKLSSGELQRIDLAEVLQNVRDVLLLDEATSNLDYESERYILKNIMEKYKKKTVIFIAHRLTSIIDFERIIVFNKGKIIEEGTHKELIKKGDFIFHYGRM